MPSYELEVNEDDGSVTRKVISSRDWYGVGDVFEDEGRALRVWRTEPASLPCDERLVCDLYEWEAFIAETDESEPASRSIEEVAGTPRNCAIVAQTVSPEAARRLGDLLKARGLCDVDVDAKQATVWCFFTHRAEAPDINQRVLSAADRAEGPTLHGLPQVRVWNEVRHRYVDPRAPDEDPDTHQRFGAEFDPADIRWRVRLELSSVWQSGRVRGQLPALGRPEIGSGIRYIDIGVSDFADAQQLIERATSFEAVAAATASELSRFQRWRIRERLTGNYAVDGR